MLPNTIYGMADIILEEAFFFLIIFSHHVDTMNECIFSWRKVVVFGTFNWLHLISLTEAYFDLKNNKKWVRRWYNGMDNPIAGVIQEYV